MRITLVALTALATTSLAAPAHADPYRWCGDFGGRGGGGTSCYFSSFEQCRIDVSGKGGFCRPNPFYDGLPVRTPDDSLAPRYHRRSY